MAHCFSTCSNYVESGSESLAPVLTNDKSAIGVGIQVLVTPSGPRLTGKSHNIREEKEAPGERQSGMKSWHNRCDLNRSDHRKESSP